jgi:AcrR family transcriptional regulator
MESKSGLVKRSKGSRIAGKRGYNASRRREHAARNRGGVLDAAERLFLRDGYAATTIASIAAAAAVSVETIYKAFGGKAGLVRAIRERRLGGQGPVPAEQRSDRMRAREPDPRKIISNWATLTTEVAPLVSPILLLVRAGAGADPEMATLLEEMDADRLRRMTTNARHLHDAGHLRPGVTLRHAAEVLWTYSSPELYELLVLRRGWPLARYGRFVGEAMIAALLPPASGRGRTGKGE